MEAMIPATRASPFASPIEWGFAARPLEGQTVSGDLHYVCAFAGGVLVAVIDGLGHGPEAALASRVAAATLGDHLGESATALVEHCHVALQRTRGAVLSLAIIDPEGREMTWLGVGNVDATLHRAGTARSHRESLPHRGGVVGYQLPPLGARTLPLDPGDTLVFATDGIASTFNGESPIGWHPQDAADHILRVYGKPNDDALVVVARTVGGRPLPA
jgi:serine phosphatase RsbU (regulator of sigma subunit)